MMLKNLRKIPYQLFKIFGILNTNLLSNFYLLTMIKIKRPKTPDIAIYTVKKESLTEELRTNLLKLIDKDSVSFKSFIPRLKDNDEKFTKAEKETLEAINYYSDTNNLEDDTKKPPTFNVYKDKELKKEISSLFNKKCAYCDSTFLATSNADIEHFRPKKAYNSFRDNKDEKLIEPGYYWLAAEWDNLLWSCILCNRKNRLDQPNEEGLKPLGKKNRFPISKEEKRIRSHNQDLKKEIEFLLIVDPCRDDPMEHFDFPVNNSDDLGIVKAKLNGDGKPSEKAVASIPLYGLNRLELVISRKEVALDLKSIFIGLLNSIEAFTRKKDAGENTTIEAENFKFQKERLKAKFASTSNYLSMKQFLLKDFEEFPLIKKLGLNVNKLLE